MKYKFSIEKEFTFIAALAIAAVFLTCCIAFGDMFRGDKKLFSEEHVSETVQISETEVVP